MAFATKVKEGGDFKPFPRGLKDGSNRRRVLPGIHSCSETGEWACKHSTHTYAVGREDDPEKKDYFTFRCVEVVDWVNREKVVLETCPECVLIADQDEDFKKLQTKLKEELKSGQRTKDEVRKLLRPYIEWKRRHGRSFWWAVNVMDSDGKFFTEKWPNDVKKQFDVLKKKLKDEDNIGAILPLDQGIWVDIIKTPGTETGTGFPEYKVEVVMERRADGAKVEKMAPLAETCDVEAEKGCWDITNPGIIELTRDQVKQLATSGDAIAVIRGVFKQSQKVTPPAPKKETAPPAPSKPATPPPAPKAEETPARAATAADPVPSTPPAGETEDERIIREANEAIALAQARRKAARAEAVTPPAPEKKAETPPPAPAKAAEPAPEKKADPAPAKADSVDDDLDQFMKDYELGGDDK